MRYRLLGNLAVERDDGVAVDIPAPKRRALLAILLLQRGRPITRERLIELLWGDEPPDAAEESLFAHVSRLRRDIGRDRIPSVPGGYRLALADDELDVAQFERDLEAGRRALASERWWAASTVLGEALGRWDGSALAEFAGEAFAQPEISRLQQLREAAQEDRIGAELELGRHNEVLADLERLVKVHPFRERLWALLMVALYRAGRQSDALDRYQQVRTMLVRDLGIEPSAELQQLQGRILRQDPALAPPRHGKVHSFEMVAAAHDFPVDAPGSRRTANRDRRDAPGVLRFGGIGSLGMVSVAVVAIVVGGLAAEQPAGTSPGSASPGSTVVAAATAERVERILFPAVRPREESGCGGGLETRLYLVTPAGSAPIRVTRGGDVFEVAGTWSPDGTRIAFMGEGSDRTSLFVMNADGSGLRDLLPTRPPSSIPGGRDLINWMAMHRPAWTADGDQIVFTYGQGGVWVVRPDGTGLEQLIPDPMADPEGLGYSFDSPTSLPDGRIAVEVGEPGTGDVPLSRLYVADADGSGLALLPGMPDDVLVEGAAWSADGRLAFHGERWTSIEEAPTADLYVVDASGAAPRLLPGTTGIADAPAWSPDGTRLAFAAGGDLFTIGVDGTDRVRVATDPDVAACGASWVETAADRLPQAATAAAPGETAPVQEYHRGFLEPGRYRTALFDPAMQFSLGDGWYGNRSALDSLRIDHGWGTDAGFKGYVVVGRIQVVATSPCPAAEGRLIGPTAAEFIGHLAEHPADPGLEVTDPAPVNYGGRTGLAVDVLVARPMTGEQCPGAPPPFLNMHGLFEVGDRVIAPRTGDRLRVVSLDVGDGPAVTFLLVAPTQDFETYAPVTLDAFEAFLDMAQPILDSLAVE